MQKSLLGLRIYRKGERAREGESARARKNRQMEQESGREKDREQWFHFFHHLLLFLFLALDRCCKWWCCKQSTSSSRSSSRSSCSCTTKWSQRTRQGALAITRCTTKSRWRTSQRMRRRTCVSGLTEVGKQGLKKFVNNEFRIQMVQRGWIVLPKLWEKKSSYTLCQWLAFLGLFVPSFSQFPTT